MTPPDDRATFVARVRTALGRSGPLPAGKPPELPDALVRLVKDGPGLADLFARRAASSGMTVHRSSPDARWRIVQEILQLVDAARVVMDSHDDAFARARVQLAATGVAIIGGTDRPGMDASFEADVGITGVHAAVAETGSLVLASGRGQSRSAFIVPPVHIAIVREDQIVADLLDLPSQMKALPTALTLISGPSKTADIEGILITGVHGPGRVHVVLESV
jgi:L-lactate utilization protein LutC